MRADDEDAAEEDVETSLAWSSVAFATSEALADAVRRRLRTRVEL